MIIAIISGLILILLLVYYCIMKTWFYNLEESDISESDRKLTHWVSPHMHQEARNFKTSIEKVSNERDLLSSKSIQNKKSSEDVEQEFKLKPTKSEVKLGK